MLVETEAMLLERWPALVDPRYPRLLEELMLVHAEELLAGDPDLPRKRRETAILRHPAVFIYGIGWPLADGLPHELRVADYDDRATEAVSADGRPMHGPNGASSSGARSRAEERAHVRRHPHDEGVARPPARASGQLELLEPPYHQAIMRDEIPLSIGAGVGESRTTMLLQRKARLGEVSVSVWAKALKEMCAKRNVVVDE